MKIYLLTFLSNIERRRVSKNGAFTLIELLIVIAIIGTLTSIVIASLNSARSKGDDAAIKADLNQIRAQADLVYEEIGNLYCDNAGCPLGAAVNDPDCGAITPITPPTIPSHIGEDPKIQAELDDAILKNGGNPAKCVIGPTGYAIAIPLKTDPSQYWCIDSQGINKQTSAVPADDTFVCP